jgi:hypothetical protein
LRIEKNAVCRALTQSSVLIAQSYRVAWLSISFEAPAEHVDALSDALLEAGAASVEVTDADAGSPADRGRGCAAG